jgi:hypothetical protein
MEFNDMLTKIPIIFPNFLQYSCNTSLIICLTDDASLFILLLIVAKSYCLIPNKLYYNTIINCLLLLLRDLIIML